MAPWIGSDLSERLIVPLLEELSQESELGIRRVCASLYRDLCSVVSTEVSESRLVGHVKNQRTFESITI